MFYTSASGNSFHIDQCNIVNFSFRFLVRNSTSLSHTVLAPLVILDTLSRRQFLATHITRKLPDIVFPRWPNHSLIQQDPVLDTHVVPEPKRGCETALADLALVRPLMMHALSWHGSRLVDEAQVPL